MNDDAVLDNLLKIEAEADSFIDDAQAEADRRIIEGERKCRAIFDLQFQKGVANEEKELQNEISTVRENCKKELEIYREKLNTIKADNGRFCEFLDSLFLRKE